VLLVSDLRGGDCDTAVQITETGTELGVPLEAGGRVFVRKFSTGRVLMVDLASGRVVARPRLLEPGEFELLTKDGIVFYNDLDSERAGVVRLDGSVRRVAKYNPSRPGSGLAERPGSGDEPRADPTDDRATGDRSPREGIHRRRRPARPPAPRRLRGRVPTAVAAKIRLSPSNQGSVGDMFTFEVVPVGASAVRSARWTFGDSQGGDGTRVTHAWSTAGVFKVYAQVVMADGREVVADPVTMTIGTEGDTAPPVIESLTHDPP
jgi:hypothetical protein